MPKELCKLFLSAFLCLSFQSCLSVVFKSEQSVISLLTLQGALLLRAEGSIGFLLLFAEIPRLQHGYTYYNPRKA